MQDFKDRRNVFDFIIIVLSLWPTRFIPMPVQLVRTVRLFRVVRVFRIVSLFKQMRIARWGHGPCELLVRLLARF